MSDLDLSLLLAAEHAWKCRQLGLTHDLFGESGTRSVKMINQARSLMQGRLESRRGDLIADAHGIYLARIAASPAPYLRGGKVDSGRVDGFVLNSMSRRANWYYRMLRPDVSLDEAMPGEVGPLAVASEDAEARWHLRRELIATLRVLVPEHQIPLRHHLKGRKNSEIADMMGLTEPQVGHRIRRAVEILQQRLGNRDDLRDLLPD